MSTMDNQVHFERRIVIREVDGSNSDAAAYYTGVLTPELGQTVTVGRRADLLLGVDLDDDGVSRFALSVTAQADGWHISFDNRNGATLQLWAHAPVWAPQGTTRSVLWPRVGVRVEGNKRQFEHWVLLECDAFVVTRGTEPAEAAETHVVRQPTPLTETQLDAVYTTFEEQLTWPPLSAPKAWPLDTAGRRLGIGPSAVRERLRPVQERARQLGLHSTFSITEPDYMFHLAARGYLERVPAPINLSRL